MAGLAEASRVLDKIRRLAGRQSRRARSRAERCQAEKLPGFRSISLGVKLTGIS
jgi:hypothetical protein